MTDAEKIVENLINTDGIHAFVFICEAADKYLPIIDSVVISLENGRTIKATDLDRHLALKVDETRKTLKREDRIVWALRFFKKALIEQIIWMIKNDPEFFQKKFRSRPTQEQPALIRQLQKLSDVDITPFREFDPEYEDIESPYSAFTTIDAINNRLEHFVEVMQKYGENDPTNVINSLRFDRQSFGEIISLLRRGEIALRRKKFPGGILMTPTPEGPFDLQDKEGPVETVVEFPDGWRWFDLHRAFSPMRDDRTAASDIAITGHCANNASQSGETAFELAEPLGNNRWKHHAFFVLHSNGQLGERKGRKNQKPSPRLEKYIFELLRRVKKIRGLSGPSGWNSSHDFALNDLTKPHLDILRRERPEIFSGISVGNDEDDM